MRNKHYRTWNMARNNEKVKYEKYKLQDLDCVEKTAKTGK